MARAFAACDARLALLDIDAAVLQAACASLQAEFPGVQVQTWAAAVNDEAAVNDAVHAAHAAFGHIATLLNNAGISMNKTTMKLSVEQDRKSVVVGKSV